MVLVESLLYRDMFFLKSTEYPEGTLGIALRKQVPQSITHSESAFGCICSQSEGDRYHSWPDLLYPTWLAPLDGGCHQHL